MNISKKIIISILALTCAGIFLFNYLTVSKSKLSLTQTQFHRLPNWDQDDHSQAFVALQQSCGEILKRNAQDAFSSLPQSGKVMDWQTICAAALKITKPDKMLAQQFFETWFLPYSVKNYFNSQGLFTGYYLPLLQGSLKKSAHYSIPIYALPKDLVRVNLKVFRPEFLGKNIVGQLKNNKLYPYPERAQINSGAIHSAAKVLVWCNNLIDVFFAQIQGSAVVKLANQKQFLIGYIGDNGRPYTPIGKVLADQRALDRKSVSMQSIRQWLVQHPDQIDSILNHNASYVFFRALKTSEPLGAEQVPLTAQRSLAVDTRYIPLGAPVWLDTQIPQINSEKQFTPFQHLLIAQDTGGSIKGVVRGDVYWGAGDEAAVIAGRMQSKGRYWILLPRQASNTK